MNIDRNPYRDDNYVLRCRHGAKLHLACDQCQAEERQHNLVDFMNKLAGFVGACCATAIVIAVVWWLFTGAW